MTPQDFLYYQIGVAIFLVVILITARKKLPPPSKLDLSKEKVPGQDPLTQWKLRTQNSHQSKKPSFDLTAQPNTRKAPKSLNVMFNYNGHSWDAYEVLGLPAGSSFEEVQAAYIKLVGTSKPETVDFLTTAMNCIRKNL